MALQIWRPNPDGCSGVAANCYTLVCENVVSAETGVGHFDVPPSDHCIANAQDVIGWFHLGQGVVDFDRYSALANNDDPTTDENDANDVRWKYGNHPGIGGELNFDGGGAGTSGDWSGARIASPFLNRRQISDRSVARTYRNATCLSMITSTKGARKNLLIN
jgi:hypothetical protein